MAVSHNTPDRSPSAKIWNSENYAVNAGFVPALGETVLSWLAPQRGEAILDLGCGDGVLTQKLVDTGAQVLGMDFSAAMLEKARERGITTRLLSGTALDYDGAFDAVFSNAALHWMGDLPKVFAGVFRALKPCGRFVGECGGFGNVAAIVTALVGALEAEGIAQARTRLPWIFPRPERTEIWLEAAGFVVRRCDLVPRPVALPTHMAGWLTTFADPFFAGLDAALAARATARALSALAASLQDETGTWHADYVRLRFEAHKPG